MFLSPLPPGEGQGEGTNQMPKAVVLLSGGLDSVTALAIAQEQGFDCYTLSLDYGQRHNAELNAAKRLAQAANVQEHKIIQLGLGDFETWVDSYRRTRQRPEPLIEFAIDWLRRNVPKHRDRPSFIVGDAHQARDELQRYAETLGVDHLLLRVEWPGLAHRDALENIERIADVVGGL